MVHFWVYKNYQKQDANFLTTQFFFPERNCARPTLVILMHPKVDYAGKGCEMMVWEDTFEQITNSLERGGKSSGSRDCARGFVRVPLASAIITYTTSVSWFMVGLGL